MTTKGLKQRLKSLWIRNKKQPKEAKPAKPLAHIIIAMSKKVK